MTILSSWAVRFPIRMTPRPLIFAKLEPFTIGSGSGGDAGQPHCPLNRPGFFGDSFT